MGQVNLLRASAGSGKTWRLAYEYVRAVVAEPTQYAHILAVTFTNKATAEMKKRIVEQIKFLARGEKSDYLERLRDDLGYPAEVIKQRAASALTRILHDYSHFSVLTIDKFFQRVIHSFIRELGLDVKVTLQLETGGLLSAAADRITDELALDVELREWVVDFVEEKIEENRHWEIKRELMGLGSAIFSEDYRRRATNESSKEQLKLIVERVSARADEIISSAQKSAKQSLHVIEANGLSINDFYQTKSGVGVYLKKVADGEFGAPNNHVLKTLEEDVWASKSSPRRKEIEAIAPLLRPDIQHITSLWNDNSRLINSAEILRRNYRNFALLTDLAAKMEAICASENLLPIAETNNIIHRLVAENDAPFIFEKVGNHFSRIMIDEFQDTSAMQWENFLPLIHNALAQSEDSSVLLVGDVKQSIYRWRGGDWRILSDKIERIFRDLKAENLDTNHRSLENIVAFNNDIIDKMTSVDNARLNAEVPDNQELTDMLARAYEGHRQKSARGAGGYVTITERDDLMPVIERVRDLLERGFRAGDIAILVRVGKEGREVAGALLEHGFQVVTQEALTLNSAPVTAFVLACYKLAADPHEELQRVIFNRWLLRPLDAKLTENDDKWLAKLGMMSPEKAFENIVRRYSLGAKENDVAYLQALEDQVFTFSRTAIGDVMLFAKWWDENGTKVSLDTPKTDNAITVTTIHKAKGLQYRAVIVPWCSWSLVPKTNDTVWADASVVDAGLADFPVEYSFKMRDSHLAAEYFRELVMTHVDAINVFYVAATRAEEELHLMFPAEGRNKNKIDALLLEVLGERREFGEPVVSAAPEKPAEKRLKIGFSSFSTGGKLRLRRPSGRYEGARGLGVAMHKAFENAANFADIERAVDAMIQDGILTAGQATQLREHIQKALENPEVRSWFEGGWVDIRCESSILTTGGLQRPDRVMMRDDRAVVVDYKFGLSRSEAHARQVRDYASLLKKMGYTNVAGYVWYVSLGDIVTAA